MTKTLHIYRILLAVIAVILAQACDSSHDDGPLGPDADCFALRVNVPLAAATAAAADDLNEFKVRSLHLYFFRSEGHDDASSEYVHDVIVDGEFDFSRQLRLELPGDAVKEGGLFGPDSDVCHVYAVANVDESLLTAKTVDALEATVVGSGFDETKIQHSFAMDGFATLTLDRRTRSVTGTITLQRAAAKLTLSVDVPASIEVEQKIISPIDGTEQTVLITYYPRTDDMHVWIANGVKQSELNTPAQPVDEERLYSNEVYVAEGTGSPFTRDSSRPKYQYLQDIPFYSYPNSWDPYSPKGNCYLTLELPWQYTDENGTMRNVVTYYRLSVRPESNCIERNTLYDMRVTISRLGGTSVQQPVDMLFDWNYNMQWNVQTLPTDIKEIRYLVLNNNNFSSALDTYAFMMENETSISIPYNTSHPVEIESVKLSWRDFYNNADRSITLVPSGNSGYTYSDTGSYSPTGDFAGIEIDADASVIRLRRDMVHIAWSNNRPAIRTDDAINAYTFTIKLKHIDAAADEPSARATVVITQIPAIYITTQSTASNRRFINNQNTTYRTNIGSWWNPEYIYKGYVTTNNSYPNDATQRRFWLGSYHNDDYVKNKNTYILTISKFATDDNYIIADPRTRNVDNLNESNLSASATASWSMEDDTNARLEHYYPADRDASKTRFIAPQLRVASQWGVTYQISRTGAERRCASYQEDGRPAGRWRLPTAAEIEYISRLSNKRYIPYLFGSSGETANYWCASGGIDVDNDTNNPSVTIVETNDSERRAVRCVYDEWFWTTDTLTNANKGRFRWGDRARSTNGN